MPSALALQSQNTPCRVLLVGAPPCAAALRAMLAGIDDIELVLTDAGRALEQAALVRPAVIVRALGDSDDNEFLRACRNDQVLRDLPLVVLASEGSESRRDAAFAAGASDFLAPLPSVGEVLARLRYHASACRIRQERDDAQRRLRQSEDALARLHAELDRLAGHDSLTGIPNRRRLDDVAQTEWQRGRRSGQPLSLLLCDVDNFEHFNERLGRDAGDQCLRRLAGVLTGQLKRSSDMAARFDGKQFAILLPDTGLDGAVQVAESCRAALERLALSHPAPERRIVTMSVGLATTTPSDEGMFEALTTRALEAVEAAKARGRNRVVAFRA